MGKKYSVKIYDRTGTTLKGTYDPIGGYAFSKTINGGNGSLNIRLPRKFDDYGLGEDVNLLDEIQIWVQDKDSNGVKIYSGYVAGIKSTIDGDNQYITIWTLGYVSRLGFTLDWDGTNISIARNSQTPGELVKDVIDKYRSNVSDEKINYEEDIFRIFKSITGATGSDWTIYNSQNAGVVFEANNEKLYSVSFDIKKHGNPTGNVYIYIYETIGSFGNIKPTGSAIAVSDAIDVTTLGTSYVNKNFVFTGIEQIQFDNKYYAAVVAYADGDASNNIKISALLETQNDEQGVYYSSTTWYADLYVQFSYSVKVNDDSVDINGTDISYTSNAKNCIQTIDRAREMAGATWYWYVDADNVFYFREYPATPTHKFVFGKDISYIEIDRNADDIKNEFIFWNGLQPDDDNYLSTRYYNTASISSYWNRFSQLTDSRILDDATADELAQAYIDSYKDPNVSLQFEVKDNNFGDGYDIESINPGDTCKILNLENSDVIGDNMVITSVNYTPEKAIINVADLREITGRSLTNIRRQLDNTVYGDRPADLTSEEVT